MTISRIRKPEGPSWQPTELVSMLLSKGARDVVSHWISHGQFLDDAHQPRSLSFADSGHSEFNALVSQVGPHLAPATIQNELLRKGFLEQDDSGSLLLRRSAYIPGAHVPGLSFANDQAFVVKDRMVSGNVFRRRRDDII